MKQFFKYFLQGLLYIAPMAITGYIIYLVFAFVDGILEDFLFSVLKVRIPGLGLIILAVFLALVGFLGQSILARPLKILAKRLLEKVPMLNMVYSAFNDLLSALVGKEKKFSRPVMVVVNPITNLEKLGFLTEENLAILDEVDKVAVYFPHSYNFSGELFIVPKAQVRPILLNPGDVMKFIVSGGVAGFADYKHNAVVDLEVPVPKKSEGLTDYKQNTDL
jgi:uncharacterized membrane protein